MLLYVILVKETFIKLNRKASYYLFFFLRLEFYVLDLKEKSSPDLGHLSLIFM
jgi:hypothetical protein